MMNHCNSNASIESLCRDSEKEYLPFALEEHLPSRKEYNDHDRCHELSAHDSKSDPIQSGKGCTKMNNSESKLKRSSTTTLSQNSFSSSPPGLIESDTTDGTSCCSGLISSIPDVKKTINYQIPNTSTMLPSSMVSIQMSSFFSSASINNILSEPAEANRTSSTECRPNNRESIERSCRSLNDSKHTIVPQPNESLCTLGFSQLMREADDSDTHLGRSRNTTSNLSERESNARLSPLLENQGFESGALISGTPEYSSTSSSSMVDRMVNDRPWWHKMALLGRRADVANRELEAPLLTGITETSSNCATSSQPDITRLLSSSSSYQQNHGNFAFNRSIVNIQTNIESDDSFEISLSLGENSRCTVDDVMDVISNTDLLSLWCDPVGTLIVTSNSSNNSSSNGIVDEIRSDMGGNCSFGDGTEKTREYEGEWIEATTSTLESPSCSFGSILGLGQSILQGLGCTSYGRVTIFTERRRGHIFLTIGPFHGGIYASHSIFVSLEDTDKNQGRIRIVDRVRLTRGDDNEEPLSVEKIFGCSVMSRVSECFFPSVVGYVGQMTTSMERLRILLENNKNIISTSRPRC